MSRKLEWDRARKPRPPTDTPATRKLDYRADRYLAAVDANEAKRKAAKKPKA